MSDFINTIDELGDEVVINSIIERTITEFADDKLMTIGIAAFQECKALVSVNLPNVTTIGQGAFSKCSVLEIIKIPLVESIGEAAFEGTRITKITKDTFPVANYCANWVFNGCKTLTEVVLPSLTRMSNYAFYSCTMLSSVDLPLITTLPPYAFQNCSSLKTVILRGETLCSLYATNAFSNCHHYHGTVNATYNPDGLKDGYVYVPKALIEEYKVATNWSTLYTSHPNIFRALEDYTVDGTITGELDNSKI